MDEKIGFIGLGKMGTNLALNLIREGFNVAVYNRSQDKAEALVKEGAKLLKTPSEAFNFGTMAISMVANDLALEEVVFGPDGLGENIKEGALHLSMSTVSPETNRHLAIFHEEKGAALLACPVFGRPEAAFQKKLWIALSGQNSLKPRALKVLNLLGQKVVDFGEDPGAANVVKLAGNFLISSAIESMSESFSLLKKNQVNLNDFISMMMMGPFACPVYQTYSQIIVDEKFEPPGFTLMNGLKDISLALECAEVSQVPMPLLSLLHNRFLSGMAKGREDMDWSSISLSSFEDAGIPSKQFVYP